MTTRFFSLPLGLRLFLSALLAVAMLPVGFAAYLGFGNMHYQLTHQFVVVGTVANNPEGEPLIDAPSDASPEELTEAIYESLIENPAGWLPKGAEVTSTTMTKDDEGISLSIGFTMQLPPCSLLATQSMGKYDDHSAYEPWELIHLRRILRSAPTDISWVLKLEEDGKKYVVHRFDHGTYAHAWISSCETTEDQEAEVERIIYQFGDGLEIKEIRLDQ